jgi:hypothetical protein
MFVLPVRRPDLQPRVGLSSVLSASGDDLTEAHMQATKGDHLIIHGRTVGNADRRGEVIDVRGQHGEPPYVVRWEPDGHEGLVFPGPDCEIEAAKTGSGKKQGHKKGKK